MKVSLVDDDSRVVGPDHIFWVGMTSASPSGPKNHWVWLQTHQKITMYGVIKVNRPKNKFEFSCVVGWLAKVSVSETLACFQDFQSVALASSPRTFICVGWTFAVKAALKPHTHTALTNDIMYFSNIQGEALEGFLLTCVL